MKPFASACVVAASLAAAQLSLGAADSFRFTHLATVYADLNGAGFDQPEGLACTNGGDFVVADTGNARLVRFAFHDRKVTGGSEIKVAQLAAPVHVQLDAQGEIYALDGAARRIVHLGATGEFKGALTMNGVPNASSVVPKSFALDPSGNVYVLDVFGQRVVIVTPQGEFQKAIELPADIGFATDVAVDAGGSILVLDSVGRRILSAARDATAFKPLGGDLTQYVPTLPTALVPLRGSMLVVEGPGSRLVAFTRDGAFISRQLTMGWNDGQLRHPSQTCSNGRDEVFVADRDNSRVQIFQLAR